MFVFYCQLGNALTLFFGGIHILYLWCNFHNHCTCYRCVYVGRKPKGAIFRVLKVVTRLTQIIFRSRSYNGPEWPISNICPLAPRTVKKPQKSYWDEWTEWLHMRNVKLRSQLKFCAQYLSSYLKKTTME